MRKNAVYLGNSLGFGTQAEFGMQAQNVHCNISNVRVYLIINNRLCCIQRMHALCNLIPLYFQVWTHFSQACPSLVVAYMGNVHWWDRQTHSTLKFVLH